MFCSIYQKLINFIQCICFGKKDNNKNNEDEGWLSVEESEAILQKILDE